MFGLTGDMIGHQLSPALLAFFLNHKFGMALTDITGKPFCQQSKSFQSEFLRISMIYEAMKNRSGQHGAAQSILETADEDDSPMMRALGGMPG